MLRMMQLATLVMACAVGGAFGGAVGALGVGGVLLLLAKLTRAHRIPRAAQWTILPLAFVAMVVVQPAGRNVMKQAASSAASQQSDVPAQSQAPEAASAQETVTSNDGWNKAALAFESAHPELKQGNNTAIMQRIIDTFTDSTEPPSVLLQNAYLKATHDAGWMRQEQTTIVDPWAQYAHQISTPTIPPPPAGFTIDGVPASAANVFDQFDQPTTSLNFNGHAYTAEKAQSIVTQCDDLMRAPATSFGTPQPARSDVPIRDQVRYRLRYYLGYVAAQSIEADGLKLEWSAPVAIRRGMWIRTCHAFTLAYYDNAARTRQP